jgi:hypothetical protein
MWLLNEMIDIVQTGDILAAMYLKRVLQPASVLHTKHNWTNNANGNKFSKTLLLIVFSVLSHPNFAPVALKDVSTFSQYSRVLQPTNENTLLYKVDDCSKNTFNTIKWLTTHTQHDGDNGKG